jgi:antitoxin MazE
MSKAPVLSRVADVSTVYIRIDQAQNMESVIRKWGNSAAVRLPVSVIKEAAFRLEQRVNIVVTRGRIVIEPSTRIEYDLDEMIAGITAKNRHDESSFGGPVGKETL